MRSVLSKELHDALWAHKSLTVPQFYALFKDVKERSIRVALSRMENHRIIHRVKRGVYSLRQPALILRSALKIDDFQQCCGVIPEQKVSLHNLEARKKYDLEKLLPKLQVLDGWVFCNDNKCWTYKEELLKDCCVTVVIANSGLITVHSQNTSPFAAFSTKEEFEQFEKFVGIMLKPFGVKFKDFTYYGFDYAVDDFTKNYEGPPISSPLFADYVLKYYNHEGIFRKEWAKLANKTPVPNGKIHTIMDRETLPVDKVHGFLEDTKSRAQMGQMLYDSKFLYRRFANENKAALDSMVTAYQEIKGDVRALSKRAAVDYVHNEKNAKALQCQIQAMQQQLELVAEGTYTGMMTNQQLATSVHTLAQGFQNFIGELSQNLVTAMDDRVTRTENTLVQEIRNNIGNPPALSPEDTILQILQTQGEQDVGQITTQLNMKHSTVGTLLCNMFRDGQINRRKEGKKYIYRIEGQ